MTNKLLLRTTALVLHLISNFILLSALLSVDWTGSWLKFFLFILIVLLLVVLFVKHLLSFISFIKSRV